MLRERISYFATAASLAEPSAGGHATYHAVEINKYANENSAVVEVLKKKTRLCCIIGSELSLALAQCLERSLKSQLASATSVGGGACPEVPRRVYRVPLGTWSGFCDYGHSS